MLRKDWKSSFGNKLGAEINKIADAIREAQIISSPNVKVSHSPRGTLIEPQPVSSPVESDASVDAVYELAMVVAPTADDIDTIWGADYNGTFTGGFLPAYDPLNWDNKNGVAILTQPCTIDGNPVSGREDERNWVIQCKALLSDYGQSLQYMVGGTNWWAGNATPHIATYHIPWRGQLYYPAQLTGYVSTNPHHSWTVNNGYWNDAVLKLNKTYDYGDIILLDIWAEDTEINTPVYQLWPYDGVGDYLTNTYPYVTTPYYDTNAVGRYYVHISLPDLNWW